MKKGNKNFDGLDHTRLNPDRLIGQSGSDNETSTALWPNPKVDLEDPDGILPDDMAEVFQAAIKNIINAGSSLKTVSVQEDSRDGGDIFLDLALNNQEAEKGGYLPLQYQRFISCSQCQDQKTAEALKCPKCGGIGRVMAHRRVEIKVPQNAESGAVLRVAGEGHAPSTLHNVSKRAGAGPVQGDLFVKIIIREREDL